MEGKEDMTDKSIPCMVNKKQKKLLDLIKSQPQNNSKIELIVELLELLVNHNTNQMEAWKSFGESIKSIKRDEDVQNEKKDRVL